MSILEAVGQQTRLPQEYLQLSVSEMEERVRKIKQEFGTKLYIPGHHYQKDKVIQFADDTGDSLQLAQLSAKNQSAQYIVFCGVHFMAETADILTNSNQKVVLPDLRAGCSMADMADIYQTERAWVNMQETFGDTILPLTYVNSTAAIKAFCGRNGGATVTSSNAKKMIEWAFTQKERMLFLPDQHLGRNTAADLGIELHEMVVWDPINNCFEGDVDLNKVKVILWKGHCSVHEKFTVQNIEEVRSNDPDISIIVHPECSYEVVQQSDFSGSTNFIINTLNKAKSGTKWAVGTEMNLVNRLKNTLSDKEINSLNPNMCPCLTMNRIDLPHLLWCLEKLQHGEEINIISVDETVAFEAKLALDRMLARV
jgi:quinolinate synthase